MLITNALAIVWLLNKQVGVLSLISELLNCSAEIWTIQNDTTCDSYRYRTTQRETATCKDFYLSY